MKTVKDPAALKQMALKSGAKVSDGSGNQFNTSKVKAAAPKRMEPEVPMPEPTVAPKPEKPDAGSMKVAETIVDVGKSNATMLEQIKDQIANIQMKAAEPITHWEFDFIRDDKGYLVRLIADGSAMRKVLN
jgi:hypothetical protein